MSTKPQRPLQDDSEEPDAHDKTIIRVKRGALRRFDQLTRKSVHLPVEVKWDRRTTERRGTPSPEGTDRRRQERRQAPPFTWDTADFAVEGDRSAQSTPAPSGDPRRNGTPEDSN